MSDAAFYVSANPYDFEKPHEVGNPKCPVCCCGPWKCAKCGGIAHIEVADEVSDGEDWYWQHDHRCESCGDRFEHDPRPLSQGGAAR